MEPFRLLALTPPALPDPSIAIAASRAGETGILDLEYLAEEAAAREAVGRMAAYARERCGIKLSGHQPELVDHLTAELPERVGLVVLTAGQPEVLSREVALLRERGVSILLEVTSLEQAQLGKELCVDGLIAKGNEAGGWVGEETTFILLQRLLRLALPVWAQGGIGLHSAAACYAAGAAGVVLDSQLALTRESPLPEAVKEAVSRMDGSETTCLGTELEAPCRFYFRPGLPALETLREKLESLQHVPRLRPEIQAAWRQAVRERAGWDSPETNIWLLGQDAAFAASLARQFHTVGGVLGGVRQAVEAHIRAARSLRPLDEDSPLAQSHRTRYPIVQGPMTRVSDRAQFALRVAEGGGLPFLALALMRAREVETLLEETKQLLGERPWGVGILGFVPLELRQEQLEVIRRYPPPFALIAGGRPDQARALERDGIPTYLHVPSPGLLRLFLQDGARRFVFEGRECGGHVGPRSSFVLWNTMVDVLLDELPAGGESDCHVIFAAGIHDALSSSMVAAMAAPLAERGVRVGVLLGTAYLFTEEAVSTGAITSGFQEQAIRCQRTVLVESGPGHSIRIIATAYAQEFEREKRRLLQEGRSAEDIRLALEAMNIGRLRIASKGIQRHPRYGRDRQAPKYLTLDQEEQHRQGMYMIGQVAALRQGTCTMKELHRDIAVEGSRRLEELPAARQWVSPQPAGRPSQVAIIGMSCMLPKARDLQTYWENILNKINAITEIPKERFDWQLYYDPDPRARDKIYSKWGGFLDDEPFDPVEFGMPPNSLLSIDPMQLLALKAARAALADSGYLERDFDRSRTSVILGASGGTGDLGGGYLLRASLPLLFRDRAPEIIASADGRLPEWTEDSFAGLLLNVAAGRIANRFDLGGLNYIVDAACASSLTATHLAVKELETGTTDMVLIGGVDTTQNPFGYLCFSKTHALSPTGQARTFDASADGIAIGEGIVMMVLKRLADAERDGDRIYAVIQSIGGSSDGKAKGLTAPRPEGQMLALRRAYAKAGIPPTTVSLFEAHGTGTVVGDRTEALALSTVLEEAGAPPQSAAIGSVKSMIGHTKATAGVAGMAKVALALYHKVLPPTLGVTEPNPKARFGEGPLYVNSETRPWVDGVGAHPRRAGVNSFGFGGTNFHAVLEEYTGEFRPRAAVFQSWPTELLLWSAPSRRDLLSALDSVEQALQGGARPELRDLAYTLWQHQADRSPTDGGSSLRLAVVASSVEDLRAKLAQARKALEGEGPVQLHDPRGIYFADPPLAREGKLAFLFPGQGSQYPNMLRELAVRFSEVREAFERADRALAGHFPRPLSSFIFPPPAFSPEDERRQQEQLTQTHIAQPALGTVDLALFSLLRKLGVQPELVAGHSYGEYVALSAAGVFDEKTLVLLSEARGRSILEAAREDLGTMAAVDAGPERLAQALGRLDEIWVANLNAPEQTVISGTRSAVERAVMRLNEKGIRARSVPVACAFHSPIVAPARERLGEFLSATRFAAPRLEVFSNSEAAPYPRDPQAIAGLLAEHLVKPVRFADEVRSMYEAGARMFVEVGPRNVLTGLTREILGETRHLALPVDIPGRAGLTQLLHVLGSLAAHGVAVRLDRLFHGRTVRRLNLGALVEDTREKPLSPTTWLVNGGRARPLHQPAAANHLSAVPLSGAPVSAAPVPVPGSPESHAEAAGADRTAPRAADQDTAEKSEGTPPALSGPSSPRLPSAPEGAPGASRSFPSPQPPAADGPTVDGTSQVMLQFQQLMSRFLETQRNVMLAYLQGAPASAGAELSSGREAAFEAAGAQVSPAELAAGPPPDLRIPALPVPQPPEAPGLVQTHPVERPAGDSAASGVAAARPDRSRLTEQLLQIVSERTGYPPEMLDLDVDIEAELGIDSIKRVEILGTVQRTSMPSNLQVDEKAMEQLTGIKTLRGIVYWLEKALGGGAAEGSTEKSVARGGTAEAPSESTAAPETAPRTAEEVELPRASLAVVDAPRLLTHPLRLAADRVLLITDDGRGIAQEVAERMRGQGAQVVLARQASGTSPVEPDCYQVNLKEPAAVDELIAIIGREKGPLGGILHLLPLQEGTAFETPTVADWRERLQREVKSLFYLARAAAKDLKQPSPGGFLLAATAMGGAYSPDGSGNLSFFPGQAGIAGLVKTLALEWPGVRCKVVGLDLEMPIPTLADQILLEAAAEDGLVEVGYRGEARRTRQPGLAPLEPEEIVPLHLNSDCVLLVTGGARGITAEVASELAERYRPTLLLAGRSPLPAPEESLRTRGLSSAQEIKAALIDEMRQAARPVALPQVEAAYNRLLKDREIRQNMERMQRAGATVRYYQVEVTDEQEMAGLIEGIYRDYGRLDGVIHGAGIIEDKLVEEKTPNSFSRVFDIKADSAFLLSRLLRPDSLKFLVFFSSVSGPFGNRGQSDYAAANEVLNKLALQLDRSWPGRVVSINWGPWQKTGMVSPELEREFARRGVELIPMAAGRGAFDRELRYGSKGEAEIILAGGTWGQRRAEATVRTSTSFPLLQKATLSNGGGHIVEAIRTLDPAHDLYLRDHQLDGEPVLPVAMAMELMAEVVQQGWPDLVVVGLREFHLLKGLIVDNGPKALRVVARAQAEPPHERLGVNVNVEITDAEGAGHRYYRTTVELARDLPEPPQYRSGFAESFQPFPLAVAEAYRKWLFHGPLFQGISEIEGIGEQGIAATLVPSTPQQCLTDKPRGEWLIDPVVFDSALQLFLLWVRANHDITPLPTRFQRYRRFGSLSKSNVQCHLHILARSREPVFYATASFVSPDGHLLGLLEEMEGAATKSLNRLAGRSAD